jgi:alkanesulfonate monooxygenase SsuD/methylene tetrahydromethanopterin reductase-like flavin-dependent oxidoreductase (luciferase family)
MTLRLGYGLITCERSPGDPRTWPDRCREALDLARRCEDVGLDSLWTSEHHFVDDGYMPSLAGFLASGRSWGRVRSRLVE